MPTPGEILATIPGFSAARPGECFSDGLTHRSYRVERGSESFVLRVDKPSAQLLELDRGREYRLVAALAAASICPPWLHWDLAEGWALRPWWRGRSWQPGELSSALSRVRLASLLRGLHRVEWTDAASTDTQDRRQPLDAYAALVRDDHADRARQQGHEALDELSQFAATTAICHNDLLCQNIAESDRRGLFLVDFEYVAVGDPLFDLATICEHHAMPDEWGLELLAAYFERRPDPVESRQLDLWRRYYRSLLTLWRLRIDGLA